MGFVGTRVLRWYVWAVLLCFGLPGLARLVSAAITTHFNSDLLFIEQLYHDFFVSRVGLAGWYLPPAPYYFPDWPIYFSLRALTGSTLTALWGYGFIIYGLICAAAFWVAREAGCRSRPAAALAVGGGLSLIAAMQASDRSMLVLFLPIFHAGALVIGLGLLALALRSLHAGFTWAIGGSFLSLCVLGAASDFFTVTQFMIPILLTVVWFTIWGRIPPNRLLNLIAIYGVAALVVVLLLRWLSTTAGVRFDNNPLTKRIDLLFSAKGLVAALATAAALAGLSWIWQVARRVALSIAILGTGLAGGLLYWKLRAVQWTDLGLAAGWPLPSIKRFAADLLLLSRASPELALAVLVCIALCLRIAVSASKQVPGRAGGSAKGILGPLPPQHFVATFFLITAAVMIGESALTWISAGEVTNIGVPIYIVGNVRHMQPLFVLPVFLLGLLPIQAVWLRRRMVQISASVLWVGWMVLRTLPAVGGVIQGGLLPHLPTDELTCLDNVAAKNGLVDGYGDYWTTRHFSFQSRRGLHLAPLADELELDFTCTNIHAFVADPLSPATSPSYSFIVEGKLPRQAILTKFGPPAMQESCGGINVLLYNRKSDVAFRSAFRIPLLTKFGLPLPSHIDGLPSLNTYRPPGTSAAADNSVLLSAAAGMDVHFLPAAAGNVLELAFDGDRRVIATIEFVNGMPAQDLVIGPVPGEAMQPRYLLLDQAGRETKIEHLRLRVAAGEGPVHLGHVFIYPDTRR